MVRSCAFCLKKLKAKHNIYRLTLGRLKLIHTLKSHTNANTSLTLVRKKWTGSINTLIFGQMGPQKKVDHTVER